MATILKYPFTVYVVERKTLQLFEAKAEPVKKSDLIGLKGKGWNFTWTQIYGQCEWVYAIIIENTIQGLIGFSNTPDMQGVIYIANIEVAPHNLGKTKGKYIIGPTLFSIACKYSVECGLEGYVFFWAKTKLINHYEKTLGAIISMPPDGMAIEEEEANILINKYI